MSEKMPSFEQVPEEKRPDSKAVKWLKRATALGGAVAVGYFGGLKKEKGPEEAPLPAKPKAVESIPSVQETQNSVATSSVRSHVEMRHVKIADGIEQSHAIEVDEKGNTLRDLGAYHLWEEAQRGEQARSFGGYGIETQQKAGEVIATPYGLKKGNKTNFSGYGISTETEGGKVTKSPYGESKDGRKKFRGYGLAR